MAEPGSRTCLVVRARFFERPTSDARLNAIWADAPDFESHRSPSAECRHLSELAAKAFAPASCFASSLQRVNFSQIEKICKNFRLDQAGSKTKLDVRDLSSAPSAYASVDFVLAPKARSTISAAMERPFVSLIIC